MTIWRQTFWEASISSKGVDTSNFIPPEKIVSRQPVILSRGDVVRLLSGQAETYQEHRLKAAYALTWCGVHYFRLHLFHLDQLDWRFGVLWVEGNIYPIQPEAKPVLSDWLDNHRRQKGTEHRVLTGLSGIGSDDKRLQPFNAIIYKTSNRWFGCPLILKDVYSSWMANYLAENPEISKEKFQEYTNNKSDSFSVNAIKVWSNLIGVDPIVQYHHNRNKSLSSKAKGESK